MAQQLEVVVHVAVGDEAIGPAVVVEIRQAQPQPTQGVLSVAIPLVGVRSSNIPPPRFMIQGVGLVPVIGDEQIGPAVAVDILGVHAHPGVGPAVGVVAGARGFGDVLECAIAAIEEHEVRAHVVGDVEVDPAVAVEVGRDDPEALGRRSDRCRPPGHVGERRFPVVSVEDVRGRLDGGGQTVGPHVRLAAEPIVVRQLPLTIIAHIKVEVAIVVIVEERPAHRPVRTADSRSLADIPERAFAVIEKKHIRAVVAEEDVLVAVVVDVSDDDAMAISGEPQARLRVASRKWLSPRFL